MTGNLTFFLQQVPHQIQFANPSLQQSKCINELQSFPPITKEGYFNPLVSAMFYVNATELSNSDIWQHILLMPTERWKLPCHQWLFVLNFNNQESNLWCNTDYTQKIVLQVSIGKLRSLSIICFSDLPQERTVWHHQALHILNTCGKRQQTSSSNPWAVFKWKRGTWNTQRSIS